MKTAEQLRLEESRDQMVYWKRWGLAGIMCVFQVAWTYYGLLITSRPVVA